MANEIVLKRSAVANNAPAVGDLALGEIAINTNDGRVFIKKNDGVDAVVDITDNVRTKTTTDPITTDDNSNGYRPGDLWLNTTSQSVFICVDDSNTAAVWTDLTGGGAFTGALLHSQWDLVHTIDNPNIFGAATNDYFGKGKGDSSISGDYVIVGAPGEYDEGVFPDGVESGKAYIFNIHTGLIAQVLDNPNAYGTTTADEFGTQVALSGNYAIVAGTEEDEFGNSQSGKVYVFDVLSGNLLYTIDNPNAYGTASNDRFGRRLSADGNNLIVGVRSEDDAGGGQSGKAYIFNLTDGSLTHTLDNPNPYGTSANDGFGVDVGISGNMCIIGAVQEDEVGQADSGKAYIFNVTTGLIVHTIDNPNGYGVAAGDGFGQVCSIAGNYAVVGSPWESDVSGWGAGRSYIFNVTTGALLWDLDNPNTYGTGAYDYFGNSISISGNYAVVAATAEEEAGGTYAGNIYVYDVTTGALVHTFLDPNTYGTVAGDQFGSTVSISDEYIMATAFEEDDGGSKSGTAYVFALNDIYETEAQNELAKLITVDGPGSGLDADTLDGNQAYHFASKEFVEDLHDRGGGLIHNQYGLMHTIDNPNAFGTSYGDFFGGASYQNSGASSAVSGDYMVVGASSEDEAGGNSSGKVYIFNIHTGLLCRVIDNPNAYGTSGNDNFGLVIDISGDICAVAAHAEDEVGNNNSGKVYIFSVPSGELLLTIDNPNAYGTAAEDWFGYAIGLDGNNLLVGAYKEDDATGLESGKAYIFNATTGALLQTIDNPNAYGTSAYDRFAKSVSISGNICVIGAEREDDATGNSSGKAYIFTVSTGALLWTLDNPNAFGTGAYDNFGLSVGIDGNYVVVGAPWEDDASFTSVGRAYIFNATTGALLFTLDDPNAFGTTYYDSFGTKIAVAGDYALIGAWYEDDASGNQSGKAYLFNVTTGVLLHTFDNPNAYGTSAYDYFGGIISLSDKHAIITSAYEDDASGNQSGKAYVFVLDDTYETDAQSLLASIISVGEGSGIDASTLQGKTSLDFSTAADLTLKANINNPSLTGSPQAPTQSPNNNSTIIATTAYADAAALAGGDPNFVGNNTSPSGPTAGGSNSLAVGDFADAKETDTIAIGSTAQAGQIDNSNLEQWAIAIGRAAKAYERGGVAIGNQATTGVSGVSFDPYGIAIGHISTSDGQESIAIGSISSARADFTIAIGNNSVANENYGIAIGYYSKAGQTIDAAAEINAIAIGSNATAYEGNGISIGGSSITGKNGTSVDPYAIAIGFQADALEEDAVALGHWARARGTSAISIGDGAWAKETSSIAIGQNSITGQTDGAGNEGNSIAIGQAAKAYEIGCVSVGYLSSTGRNGTTNDPYAVAVGYFALADQGYTTAIGQSADARGTSSSAFGSNAQALESACVAVGASAEAGRAAGGTQNTNCVAIGAVAKAHNGYCIAIGTESIAGINTGNTEVNAIAIGKTAVAPKANTIAIGTDATVTNKGEMVIGLGTNAFEKKIVIQEAFTLATLTAFTDSPVIPINKAWKFTAEVIGRQDVTGEVASYKIEGIIKNIGGTTTIVGTNTSVAQEEDATWDCVIVANNTNDTLEIQFLTDGTANAVNVLANILIMEV